MSWIKQFFGEVSHVWGATKRSLGWDLITLCRDCHWFLGHMRDWSLFNPHAIEDAANYRERFIAARLK